MRYLKYINETWNKSKDVDISAAITHYSLVHLLCPYN